jgi:hypothetical protein
MLMRRLVASSILPLVWLAAGCGERDLGECNLDGTTEDGRPLKGPAAFDLVYNSIDGRPMFEGQALVQSSCGNGQFCHSPNATGADRIGVPKGLDFDVDLACTDQSANSACTNLQACGAANAESEYCQNLKRLEDNQSNVVSWAGDMIKAIREGTMPPGPAGARVQDDSSWIRADDQSVLPSLNSEQAEERAQARDIVRNWLACASPVVARTEIAPTATQELIPCPSVDDEVCIYSGPRADLPDPTWSSIYWSLIFPQCVTCHGPTNSNDDPNPENPFDGAIPGGANAQALAALDLTGSDPTDTSNWPSDSHGAVVNVPASSAGQCEGPDIYEVVPNDVAGSLMIQKMRAVQTCGGEMPLGAGQQTISNAVIDIVEQWINAGAPND